MKKKIIIIGKNSFIAKHLYEYLKKRSYASIISYKKFMKKSNFSNIDYVINCTSTINYVKYNYQSKFDHDFLISKKIAKFTKCKLIFLSSRKIYKANKNIKENGKILLRENYSVNKYLTEKKLFQILKNRLLVLRISNLIGLDKNRKGRKLHKTFIDYFIENIRKNLIFENKNIYKDFLSISLFTKIVFLLIKKNKSGIFNVSIGKKIYLKKLIRWLNHYNVNKVMIVKHPKLDYKKFNKDSFYLNNSKLLKTINIKINLNDLKNECLRISKKLFYEKKK